MSIRNSLSKRVRFDVFKRDGFKCVYCGATPNDDVILECDHVTPVALGGPDDMENLVTACFACNRGKGATSLDSIPESLEERARRTAEKEAQLRAYREIMEAARQRREDELWEVADIFIQRHCEEYITRSRLNSIKMFLNKLPFMEVLDAMEIATDTSFGKDRMFRYFCGVCWRKINSEGDAE